MNKPLLLVLIILSALAQGCSWIGLGKSEFACPGGSTDGVRCLSAREVYKATEKSDVVRVANPDEPTSATSAAATSTAIQPAIPSRNESYPVPTIGQPMPIRTQAQIMRIWIPPWEDDAGDLHADGFLYTEIEPRRWNLGGRVNAPQAANLKDRLRR
jgi:conjugal transfer pilus assembly protein TraV